jgi:hypothetical protein
MSNSVGDVDCVQSSQFFLREDAAMNNLVAAMFAVLLVAVPAFAANDQGSFGRDVRWLDVGKGPYALYIYTNNPGNCAVAAPAPAKCATIANVSAINTYTDQNISRIELPAYASNSLICTSVSPYFEVQFQNQTTSRVQAEAHINIDATIESAVLNNPALINRSTGQPFNGKIVVRGLTNFWEAMSLQPNDFAVKTSTNSRQCVSGIVSYSTLQSFYGLSAYQARQVFANPMSVTLSATATLENVVEYRLQLGFRLFGD